MNYDAAGRLLTVKKNIDSAPSDQLISTNTYNELGQLQNKELGNNLDNLAYAYNIRGWLTSINKSFLAGTPGNYFGMELAYDKQTSAAPNASYAAAQFNGNITGTIWKTAGDGVGRKYDFTYDNANRITGADFNQDAGGAYNRTAGLDFSVSNLTYDRNGNILSMNQKGFKVGGSVPIDQLTYSYLPNSNKLAKVTDAVSDTATRLGDFHDGDNGSSDDYAYDDNGNLITDLNKGINNGILYNYLNLPQLIHKLGKGYVEYKYDALGNKLQKTNLTDAYQPVTTWLYLGPSVYQNDTLQFISHEEGRARWAFHKYTTGGSAYGFEYDFFEKDHLGNTRVVLTQQKDTAKYLASGEAVYHSTETQLFDNLATTAVGRSTASGYPNDVTFTNPNDTVFKVNGNTGGHKMGPSLLLKVMSGDRIDLGVQEYYNSGTTSTPGSSLTDVLASLATGIVSASGGAKGSVADLNNTSTSPVYAALNSFLTGNDPNPSGKPKAYLNWILLDEQLKYVSSYPQSGAIAVRSAGVLDSLIITGIPVTKSGYLYIWVSNETPNWDVFFDNLRVVHYSGPLLEETHYYPFGLTIAALSSKALKPYYAENKYRYNGSSELQNKEFGDGTGLEMYETHFRQLDPQIGRWWQIDPKPHELFSPYATMADNPLLYSDPMGDTTWVYGSDGKSLGVINDKLKNQVHFMGYTGADRKFDASKLSKKEANALAKSFRGVSVAFMGNKTASDAKAIAAESVALKKEVGFVGSVGKDKEIRLTALPVDDGKGVDKGNLINNTPLERQIDEKYPSASDQSALFLFGHTHVKAFLEGFTSSSPQSAFGFPSPNDSNGGDYGNFLYRNNDASQKGPSPGLLATPWGVTIYSSAQNYQNISYLLFQSLKQ